MIIQKRADDKGAKLVCDNFQIINGAQTTCVIANCKDDEKLKDVRILVRITKTEDIKKERKGLTKKIITYNNSQTMIRIADFRSNDDIQSFLEKELSNYQYRATRPYKKIIYLPKRKKVSKRQEEIYVTMESLAKMLYSFEYGPLLIYSNARLLFDIDSNNNGKYWYIFGEREEELKVWTTERVKRTAAIAILSTYLEGKLKKLAKERMKEGKESTVEYLSCQAKWHFLWAYGEIIRKLYPEEIKSIVNKITDGRVFEGFNFIEYWFDPIAEKIMESLDEEGIETGNASKAVIWRNWLRNQKPFDKLASKFNRINSRYYPIEKPS